MTASLYCDDGCRESWHTDMRYGVAYGTALVPEVLVPEGERSRYPQHQVGGVPHRQLGWTYACKLLDICRYCGNPLPQPTKETTT